MSTTTGRDIVKDVPNVIWVCLTIIIIAVLGGFVGLSIAGTSTDDFSRFVNTGLNLLTLLVVGGSAAVGSSTYVKAKQAADQTNGGLESTVKTIVDTHLNETTGDINR